MLCYWQYTKTQWPWNWVKVINRSCLDLLAIKKTGCSEFNHAFKYDIGDFNGLHCHLTIYIQSRRNYKPSFFIFNPLTLRALFEKSHQETYTLLTNPWHYHQETPDNFGDISLTKAISENIWRRNADLIPTHNSKYFVNLWSIPKLFSKVSKVKNIFRYERVKDNFAIKPKLL